MAWEDLSAGDPCLTYRLLGASGAVPTVLGDFTELSSGSSQIWYLHSGAAADGLLRFYLVSATGRIGGDGALGHYGQ